MEKVLNIFMVLLSIFSFVVILSTSENELIYKIALSFIPVVLLYTTVKGIVERKKK